MSLTFITLDFRGNGGEATATLRNAVESLFSPLQGITNSVLDPVGNGIAGVTGYGELEDENDRLRGKIADLESRAEVGDDVRDQLAEALSLQGLSFVGTIPTVAARVVTAPISNFEQIIELDKGSDKGVEVGMPVVSASGLVGRVSEVSSHRSRVQLITDPSSAVGVNLPTSNENGSAEGKGTGKDLVIDFIEPLVQVMPGETVVTSGVGGSFPLGIPVGRVARSKAIPGELQRWVTVQLGADLDHLKLVKVLQWKPQR